MHLDSDIGANMHRVAKDQPTTGKALDGGLSWRQLKAGRAANWLVLRERFMATYGCSNRFDSTRNGVVEYFILFQEIDGTWCAAPPSFRTSLLDPVGRGNTRQEAITSLLRDRECQELIREQGWTEPTADDFLEVGSGEINGNPNHTGRQAVLRRRAFKVISPDKA
jgi:hypothetical protein